MWMEHKAKEIHILWSEKKKIQGKFLAFIFPLCWGNFAFTKFSKACLALKHQHTRSELCEWIDTMQKYCETVIEAERDLNKAQQSRCDMERLSLEGIH